MRVLVEASRLDAVGVAASVVRPLLDLAPRGLQTAALANGEFAQTVRGVAGTDGVSIHVEGSNIRYAAMAALGLGRVGEDGQRQVLDGSTARELALRTAKLAATSSDPGAVALCAWASAEVGQHYDEALFDRIRELLSADVALPTVDVAWMVTAAVAAAPFEDTADVVDAGVERLLEGLSTSGIYPHGLPATKEPWWRAHVGSFADQIYPVQALARAGELFGRDDWIESANLTASTICRLQGDHGQWWWHYDVRDGSIIEKYPVYSVHQHAMAPMALFDLLESGGDDHTREISLGVTWLDTHPEVVEELVSHRWGLVWRKVGRREPRRTVRGAQAIASMRRPGTRVGGLDQLFPPDVVDHECRPYELGWLLYAWLRKPSAPSTWESPHV